LLTYVSSIFSLLSILFAKEVMSDTAMADQSVHLSKFHVQEILAFCAE
jgi:hypothetical protein